MSPWIRVSVVVLGLAMMAGAPGCASTGPKAAKPRKEKNETVEQPSKIKFGEFKNVEMKPFGIAEKHAAHEGNQASAKVMDGMLQADLRSLFPNLKVLPPGADFTRSAERTLQITPFIEDIRKISTGARIMLGAMAGGSHIVVKMTYRDGATGEAIADPEFVYKANAWTDSWAMGAEGNQMRDKLCRHIVDYTRANK